MLDDYNIETTKGFGIFYDNPQKAEKDRLRSDIGCILASHFDMVESLKANFKVTKYPIKEYLVAEFPFKRTPSVIIGIMKVYPALSNYAQNIGIN